jgi:formylglycine-generating enzyme required for sulfatase activity
MKMKKTAIMVSLVVVAANAFSGFVAIGSLGNAADTNGYGAVAYSYAIQDKEISIAQFGAFTNAAGITAGSTNFNDTYWNSGGRTVGTNAPAVYLSWKDAAQYCNWLTTGNANLGVYQFDGGGALTNIISRADILAGVLSGIALSGKVYALPTEDEWYKAAYYTTNRTWSLHVNGTGIQPVWGTQANYKSAISNNGAVATWDVGAGMVEQNGTYNMAGNVREWCQDQVDATNGVTRGGQYNSTGGGISSATRTLALYTAENATIGFRPVEFTFDPKAASVFMVASAWIMLPPRLQPCGVR